MAVYVVVSRLERPDLGDLIQETYGDHQFPFSSHTWFVRDSATSAEVATKLSMLGDDAKFRAGVVVIRMTGAYNGRAPQETWDWLEATIEADANG